jgi:polar amino acid transport system substrate-binding protein
MKLCLFILSILFSKLAFCSSNDELKIVTENTPPYIYLNSSGKPDGLLAERVNKILSVLKLKNEIQILPWETAYNNALNYKNTMIFPLAKNKERDKLFKYCGVIINVRTYFYKLKSRNDIIINSLDDAKKFRIGVVKEDIKYKFLAEKGFINFEIASSTELNILKFIGKREDLIVGSELSLQEQLKKINMSYDMVEKVFELKELDGRRYLAFNKNTSDEVINKFKKATKLVYDYDKEL